MKEKLKVKKNGYMINPGNFRKLNKKKKKNRGFFLIWIPLVSSLNTLTLNQPGYLTYSFFSFIHSLVYSSQLASTQTPLFFPPKR